MPTTSSVTPLENLIGLLTLVLFVSVTIGAPLLSIELSQSALATAVALVCIVYGYFKLQLLLRVIGGDHE